MVTMCHNSCWLPTCLSRQEFCAMVSANQTQITLTSDVSVDKMYSDAIFTFQSIILPVVVLWGMFANSVNVVVFLKMGCHDSVNTALFMLTVSDLLYFIRSLCQIVCLYLSYLLPGLVWYLDPVSVSWTLIWYGKFLFDVSSTTTSYIAFARCCIVVMPLKFKSTFTKSRTIRVIGGIYLFMLLQYLPLFTTQGFQPLFDVKINKTRLILWTSGDRNEIVRVVNDIMSRNVFPVINLAVTICCLFVLIYGLESASKVRRAMQNRLDKNDKNSSLLSDKDLRIIKMITLVTLSTVICNLPLFFISIFRLIFPEFDAGKTYSQLFNLVNFIGSFTVWFNLSINFVIYYTYNTQFKTTLKSLCSTGSPLSYHGKKKTLY